jgi:hypothetical protein
LGQVKDIIIENAPWGKEDSSPSTNAANAFASPDWWISHLEIELDEAFKKELIAAKKLAPNRAEASFTLKLSGFGRGAVTLTDRGVEVKATRVQAGDNIGTLDAFFKSATIARPKLSL